MSKFAPGSGARGRTLHQAAFRCTALSLLALSLLLPLNLLLALSCKSRVTEVRWETACENACEARASQCSEVQCRRGCAFALDRAEEKTTDTVVACVAKQSRCDDPEWAFCGARVGPLEHGGPPAPPLPVDPADED